MKPQTQHNFTSVYSAKTSHICDYILVPLPSLSAPAYFHWGSFDKLLLLHRLSAVDSDGLSDVEPWRNTGSSRGFCKNTGPLWVFPDSGSAANPSPLTAPSLY